MSGHLQPDEAASALAQIRHRQGKVIGAVLVPAWYWWAVAAGMVAIGGGNPQCGRAGRGHPGRCCSHRGADRGNDLRCLPAPPGAQ